MKRFSLVCLLLVAGCLAPGQERRDMWLANNPDSEWRPLVLQQKIRVGMPKDAVMAACVGIWSWDSSDSTGAERWWFDLRHYMVFRDGVLDYWSLNSR